MLKKKREIHLIPGCGRSPGEGNGNPLQYSCLENSVDREAWWATVHGFTKSQTQLSVHRHTHTLMSRTFYFSMYSHTISGHTLFTQMNDCQMTRLVNTCYRGNFPFKKIQHTHPHRAGLSAETWQMADLIPQRWSFKHTLHGVSHLNQVFDSATPWTVARQSLLSSTLSWSLRQFTSIKSVMLFHPLPLPSPFAFNPSQHQGLFQ